MNRLIVIVLSLGIFQVANADDFSINFEGDCNAFRQGGNFQLDCEGDIPATETTIEWAYCANRYGSGDPKDCNFSGLRQVRYGNGEQWVYRDVFNGMAAYQCNASNWPEADFEWSGGPYRCEIASEVKTALVKPSRTCLEQHDCAGFDMNMPAGFEGYDHPRIKSGGNKNTEADIGSFRVTCDFSHFAYDDPLIAPGDEGGSHLHAYMGNTAVNAFSDVTNFSQAGNSTCNGGTLNRSAYWVPALLDMKNKVPLVPSAPMIYYKEGYNGLSGTGFDSLPEGLGMVGRKHSWSCLTISGKTFSSIPECGVNGRLMMAVVFPQCWDGENLWLSDESHTTYAVNRGCPDSHPYAIPEITMKVHYIMAYEDQYKNVMLSSDMGGVAPGSTAHADWVNGWDKDTSDTFINNCLNTQDDCHANLLGDGTMLY